jgi:hypothetical protein
MPAELGSDPAGPNPLTLLAPPTPLHFRHFPTELGGFPQASVDTGRRLKSGFFFALQTKRVSSDRLFALFADLCYSNEAESKQWSFPVAVWPAPCEGSGKPR